MFLLITPKYGEAQVRRDGGLGLVWKPFLGKLERGLVVGAMAVLLTKVAAGVAALARTVVTPMQPEEGSPARECGQVSQEQRRTWLLAAPVLIAISVLGILLVGRIADFMVGFCMDQEEKGLRGRFAAAPQRDKTDWLSLGGKHCEFSSFQLMRRIGRW